MTPARPFAPLVPALFALTLCASAALLMAVQPSAGKRLLPAAGGTPAVWTTCLVFFQATLLAAYAYAHWLTRTFPLRWQLALHAAVCVIAAVAGAVLPQWPTPEWVAAEAGPPALGLARTLAAWVGGPFFALAATAPLLQRWFSLTGHRHAADPYFLYAASNAGSLAGLLAYPLLIEPTFTAGTQADAWQLGSAAVAALVLACGAVTLAVCRAETAARSDDAPPLSWPQVLKWLALAALASSLLSGVTAHLTTDIAPVPLLWVVPLALYLVSFMIVFTAWPDRVRRITSRAAAMAVVFALLALLLRANEPLVLVAAVHLVAFFLVALVCHGELAASRPGARHLTAFYLAVSAGGVLGGLANAVAAPVVFRHVGPAEYPLALVLAALVRSPVVRGWRFPRIDAALVAGFAVAVAALHLAATRFAPPPQPPVDLVERLARGAILFGVPAAAAFALAGRRVRFALALGVVALAGAVNPDVPGETLEVARGFFGTWRVTRDGDMVRLVHGTTQHGQERLTDSGRPTPRMYYHPTGPIGRLLTDDKLPRPAGRRVAAVGLGCGSLAAYARPGEAWTFYEIDPNVVRLARNPAYFRSLSTALAPVEIVVGDARQRLADAPDGTFDLLILDAFNSDSIPVHLLTVEALALYARKLTPTGVVAVHLSNRYLDLPPLVARTAAELVPAWETRLDEDGASERDLADGKTPSTWALLSRDPAHLGKVARDAHWSLVRPRSGAVWRDDFSNLLAAWRRGGE